MHTESYRRGFTISSPHLVYKQLRAVPMSFFNVAKPPLILLTRSDKTDLANSV